MKRQSLIVFLLLVLGGAAYAQNSANPPVALVPPQIAAAKKVFIANGAADMGAYRMARKLGDVDFAYNSFYDAMKRWGHYELAPSPAEADLVLHIEFRAPLEGDCQQSSQPMLALTIYDAKSQFALWRTIELIAPATREQTFRKNFTAGLGSLMNNIAKLAGQPPFNAPPSPAPNHPSDHNP